MEIIKENKITFDDENGLISENAKDLIKKMLRFKSKDRIKFQEVFDHPFFSAI